MSLFLQSLIVFGVTLLVMGYFQFRRSGDVVSIVQEMARPQYLVPAGVIAVLYFILIGIARLFGYELL